MVHSGLPKLNNKIFILFTFPSQQNISIAKLSSLTTFSVTLTSEVTVTGSILCKRCTGQAPLGGGGEGVEGKLPGCHKKGTICTTH